MAWPGESSHTTISSGSYVCARALASASAKKRSLYAGIRIETSGPAATASGLWAGRGRLHDLVENLVLADHAELEPRALLDRLGAALQVAHFDFQRVVARLHRGDHLALLLERAIELANPRPAGLAEAQRTLEPG